MKVKLLHLVGLFFVILTSCGGNGEVLNELVEEQEENEVQETGLVFIDEYIIPADLSFEGTVVGGLSGVDHANGEWYLISDDSSSPRFYTAGIAYNGDGFTNFEISSVILFKNATGTNLADGVNDPESIRIDGDRVVWTSEGNRDNQLAPSVNLATKEGIFNGMVSVAARYNDFMETSGPRNNGTFEALTLSADGQGYWVGMELPLIQDGPAPTALNTNSNIRVAYIDKTTGTFGREFAYSLDPVAREANFGTSFELNGLVEILAVNDTEFLFLERSFASGHLDGGYDIKIYKVDISNATDISTIANLVDANFIAATKTLLLDFEDIRSNLTGGLLDNLEGMTFGPDFENGNKSLLLVADNNFNAIVPQLNQCILLEWKE